MKDKQVQQSPEEKFEAIGKIRDNLAEKFLELGQVLSEIKSAKLYLFKGYENFKSFLATEYNLSTALANKLMRIQKLFLDEMDMDEETLLEIGYDRLGLICADLDKADWQGRDELIAKAQELSLYDLKAYLHAKREEEAKEDTDLKQVFVDQWLERMLGLFNCNRKELNFKLACYFNGHTEEDLQELKSAVKQFQKQFELQVEEAGK